MARDGKRVMDKSLFDNKSLTGKISKRASKIRSKKCLLEKDCPLSNINDEYFNSDVFYASIDPELKDKYEELIKSGEFQTKFEDFLMTEYLKDSE